MVRTEIIRLIDMSLEGLKKSLYSFMLFPTLNIFLNSSLDFRACPLWWISGPMLDQSCVSYSLVNHKLRGHIIRPLSAQNYDSVSAS